MTRFAILDILLGAISVAILVTCISLATTKMSHDPVHDPIPARKHLVLTFSENLGR